MAYRARTNRARREKQSAYSPPGTLQRLIQARDESTRRTGHYCGIERLDLKNSDPLRFERFSASILATLIAARETSKYVAASPGAREMGELVFTLLTPEGDPAVMSYGLAIHLSVKNFFIRAMAERGFEKNPGIREGDVFASNDPLVGGTHAADVFTFLPIFHEGRIIAWASGLNHITDVGVWGGSMTAYSPDTFSDGFLFPPMKVGENHEYYSWWIHLWQRRTRGSTYQVLDEKMRLAGCLIIERRVREIIEEFGGEYVERGLRETIEEARQVVERAVKSMTVPGRYRTQSFRPIDYRQTPLLLPYAPKYALMHTVVENRITPDGKVVLDVTGTSRTGFHSFNTYFGAPIALSAVMMMNNFSHQTRVNSGMMLQFDAVVPKGCYMNPGHPDASTSTFAHVTTIIAGENQSVARSFFSRGYVEEATAADGTWALMQGMGTFANGVGFGFGNMELLGVLASGAFAYKDGESALWAPYNQKCDMGNAEEWEYACPTLYYLGRRSLTDYCGHGKWRGGLGRNPTWVVLDPHFLAMNRVGPNPAATTHVSLGLCGGYPAPGTIDVTVHGTNMRERIARGEPYPRDILEIQQYLADGRLTAREVKVWRGETPPIEMKDGDLFSQAGASSGGWGDPIEREVSLVENDVRRAYVSPKAAREVYGVVLRQENDEWTADPVATEEERRAIRRRRRERSIPFRQWWERERIRVQNGDFIDVVKARHQEALGLDGYKEEFAGFWQIDAR
jgi:N-methylhydantoinase B/acetone carboxylase alpha subunit